MIKQLKSFVLFSLLLLVNEAYSMPGNGITTNPSATGDEVQCNLQPATNFHAIQTGSDYIQLGWSVSGPPPIAFNMKTYDVATSTLIYNTTFNYVSPSYTVSPLLPGRQYRFELRPVCENGDMGPNVDFLGSTVILELLVTQFTPSSSNSALCVINSSNDNGSNLNNNCDFSTTSTTTFKIAMPKPPFTERKFGMTRKPNTINEFVVELQYPNGGQNNPLWFKLNGTMEPGPNQTGSFILVKYDNSTQVANFRVTLDDSNIPFVMCDFISAEYNILKMNSSNIKGHALDDRLNPGEIPGSTSNDIVIAPNPFNDQLDIQMPSALAENEISINLYDLQGRLVTFMKTQGGTQIPSLNTSSLLPGLYLLRVECGDRIETYKVMKTQ